MICITGVPATGKTTISGILSKKGLVVCDANEKAINCGCLEDGEVDIDCLERNADFSGCDAIGSHYSHLLRCDQVFILQCDEHMLRERMRKRGYAEQKITENIDAQISGVLYFEALQRIPSTRIFKIDTTEMDPDSAAEYVMATLTKARKR